MRRSIIKPIVFGVLFGAALFFAPFFLLKALLFIVILGFIFRMFWWSRGGWHHHRMQYQYITADRIRSMSEEEYAAYKNRANNYDCCGSGYSCCNSGDGKPETKSSGTDSAEKNMH